MPWKFCVDWRKQNADFFAQILLFFRALFVAFPLHSNHTVLSVSCLFFAGVRGKVSQFQTPNKVEERLSVLCIRLRLEMGASETTSERTKEGTDRVGQWELELSIISHLCLELSDSASKNSQTVSLCRFLEAQCCYILLARICLANSCLLELSGSAICLVRYLRGFCRCHFLCMN